MILPSFPHTYMYGELVGFPTSNCAWAAQNMQRMPYDDIIYVIIGGVFFFPLLCRLLLASTRQHESEFSNIDVTSETFSAEPLSIYCHKPSIPSTVCETGVIPQPVSSEKRCQRSPSLKSFSSHLSVHHAPKPIRPDTLWIQEDNAKRYMYFKDVSDV